MAALTQRMYGRWHPSTMMGSSRAQRSVIQATQQASMVLDSEPWRHGCRAMRALSMRRDYSFVVPAKRARRDSCIELLQHHKGWGLSLDLCPCFLMSVSQALQRGPAKALLPARIELATFSVPRVLGDP